VQYFVVGPDGTAYGPADMPTLRQWAAEGRILPDSLIRDAATGQTQLASSIPGLIGGPGYGTAPYPPQQPNYMQPGGGSGYANYPRPYGMNTGANPGDVQAAWILGGIGVAMAFCCSLLGLVCGIVGLVLAKRAAANGNQNAAGPQVLCWVAIGLSVVLTALTFIGRAVAGF
jgi:hypothetical protein